MGGSEDCSRSGNRSMANGSGERSSQCSGLQNPWRWVGANQNGCWDARPSTQSWAPKGARSAWSDSKIRHHERTCPL